MDSTRWNTKVAYKFLIWCHIALQILFPLLISQPARAASKPTQDNKIAALPTTTDVLAGSLASNGTEGLENTASNMATGAAASSVEEWLSQFGTAQLKLNVDSDGNWDNSAFDFLAPLYDNKKAVLFTQLGLRAPDGRTTGNMGIGVRTFYTKNWMFGSNIFFDDDFTGENRRVGIGAEAWTNYLKLAANTYLGTTEWHSSRDFDDYNEKPADGYDVRAEGYLPAYPQLGARVMYEQYYGDKVALFDKDHLQNNPSAVTVGLSYTPISLITAGVDYKRGQDSMDETSFSLNFHYTLGQSWQSQISSDQVALRRSLAGSRYDLVDRNNEIVLQYKKKDDAVVLADMTLTNVKDNSPADGNTLNTMTVHAVTSDGKPVSGAAILWSSTGSAKLSSSSGVTDEEGNASVNLTNTTAEQVVVTATSGAISRTTPSSFVQSVAALNLQLTKNDSLADGTEQNIGQVTLKDAAGNVMPGIALSWQVSNGATIVSSDSTSDNHGRATVHFTSKTPGTMTLTANALGKTESVDATFKSDDVAAVAVSMKTNNAEANGATSDVAQAVVTDASGQPMANISVNWTVSGSAKMTTASTVNTNANGIATLNLADTVAEGVMVSASSDGKTGNTTATFTEVPVEAVTVEMKTNNVVADGMAANVAQAKVTDAEGQPMANVSVNWTVSGNAKMATAATVNTDASGIATLNLTDTAAEGVTVTASAGGQSGDTTATFTAVPVNTVAVTMTTDNSPADNATNNAAQALVTDASGQPMAGISVTWAITGSSTASLSSATTVTTNTSGIATVTLKDSAAESVNLTASAGGKTGSATSVFTPVVAKNVVLSISADNAAADNTSVNTIQAVVTDGNGKPIENTGVTWSIGGSSTAHLTTAAIVSTDINGMATVSVKDSVAEPVTIIASADGMTNTATVTFTTVPVQAVAVSMTTNNSPADGMTSNVAQAVARDANGQPMPGISLTWTLGTGNAVATTPLTVTTNASGVATLSLTDAAVEDVTVTATAGGKSGTATADFSSIKAANVSLTSTGRGSPTDKGITTALVTDVNGNPVAGARVTWFTQTTAFMTCNSGDTLTDARGDATQTCYAVSGSAFGITTTVTVNPQDTVDPSVPVTDSNIRDYQF